MYLWIYHNKRKFIIFFFNYLFWRIAVRFCSRICRKDRLINSVVFRPMPGHIMPIYEKC